jgi:hypothetical protein
MQLFPVHIVVGFLEQRIHIGISIPAVGETNGNA